MNLKNFSFSDLTIPFLILSLLAVSAIALLKDNNASDQGITATGEHTIFADPDEANAFLKIETRSQDTNQARAENANISQRVISALKTQGLTDKEIQTSSFNIYQEQNYNPETFRSERGDYVVSHVLRIKSKNVDTIGEYIDTAIENGASGVDSVSFDLSEEAKSKIREEAVKVASTKAKQKASSIAKNVGVRLGDIITISESFNGDMPIPWLAKERAIADNDTTTINPEQLEYKATVTIVYEIR